MTDQQQEAEEGSDPEADIDESDHADGADIFGEIDPDSDLDDEADDEQAGDQGDEGNGSSSSGERGTSSTSESESSESADPLGMAPDDDRVSIGDVYCNGVGLAAAAAVGSFGPEDDSRSREQLMEEYSGLARDLDLDQYVDDALAAHGGPDDLPPAHAAVLMTVVLAASIAVSEPETTRNLANTIQNT